MRQAERRATRNRAARSSVRTYVKNAADAVATTAGDAVELVRAAVRALDKAANKGIVHRNAAARRKSRLMSRLHKLSVAAAAPAEATPATRAPTRRSTARSGAEKKPTARRTTSGSTTGSRARRSG